jgi:oligopeptide transport system ATP-binding protein
VPPLTVPAPGRASACHFAPDIMAGLEPRPDAPVTEPVETQPAPSAVEGGSDD